MRMMLKFALLSRRAAPFVLAGMLCYTPLNTRAEGLTTGTAAIQPAPAQELLGPGVQFTRDVRQTPRPLVIAIVEVDLANPRLKFLATPGDPSAGRELRGMTTSNFLKRHKLRVAINGGFFDPFKSGGPLDFYPREGDAVDVFGLCAAQGQVYSPDEERYSSLNISADNKASIIDDPALAYNAVSGRRLALQGDRRSTDTAIHPRTAVGIDRDANRLILMVVDGRQPGYSEGVTLAELAGLLAERGADEALNLDGGGSSTMACADAAGNVVLLNQPIQFGIPGTERVVANHFGLTWGP